MLQCKPVAGIAARLRADANQWHFGVSVLGRWNRNAPVKDTIMGAGAMGPLILLLVGGLVTGKGLCGSGAGDGAIVKALPASMPPALLVGGRVFAPIRGNGSTIGAAAEPYAAHGSESSMAAVSSLGDDLPWLRARAADLARSWGFGSHMQFAQVAGDDTKDHCWTVPHFCTRFQKCVLATRTWAMAQRLQAGHLLFASGSVS